MQFAVHQAVENLIKRGDADNEPLTLSTPGKLQFLDLYPQVRHLFSDKATQTLDNQTYSMYHQYDVQLVEVPQDAVAHLLYKVGVKSSEKYVKYLRRADAVYSFGSFAVGKDSATKAVEKIISTVNTVANMGFTKATLYPLGILKLNLDDPTREEYVVVSYVTLTEEGKKYVDDNMPKMLAEEGAIPNKVEDQ